ncbi:hypothetical protein [Actinomadura rudentiformis]|uniref:Exo-alpha-sialidase n=1 Tax=Actinomadura rudentiformis TaxID=359158 RepID=A0A6H9YXK8_9ACTN|nr:hypothetical protein [Actinomadura rudentiformis]KAB2347334.1 hypothetical protein F8566_20190 [Actinomadura rudentiformis]
MPAPGSTNRRHTKHTWLRGPATGIALIAALLLALTSASTTPPAQQATLAKESALPASKPLGIDPPAGRYYAYAPSVVEQGSTRHVFYCGNKTSGSVHDQAMLSVGTKQADGAWTYSAPRVGLGPSSAIPWANYHVCDPEIIRGQFTWGDHVYPWAMLFTAYGCAVTAEPCPDQHAYPNQVGVAFADSLDAPATDWRIYPSPLISYELDYGAKCPAQDYCIGEPAASSIDGVGRLMVWYQDNGGFVWREVNLTNATSPVIGQRRTLPSDGLPDWLHNASVVWSPARGRFYAAYDAGVWNKHTNGPPVQTDTAIVSIDGGDMWAGAGSWRHEETITGAHSGHAFNHNTGIVRTPWGSAASDTGLEVVHAVGNGWAPGGGWGVWTYRLWSTTYSFPAQSSR